MSGSKNVFTANIAEHQRVFALLASLDTSVNAAAELMIQALQKGGRLFFCGNGGSAADAQHLAAEFTGRFQFDRKPLDAHALHTNSSSLTAVGNDYGYDQVFARGIRAHGRAGDVLIGISTSGRSKNVVLAMDAARELQIKNIALTGMHGRKMGACADVLLAVPSSDTARIQEMQIFVGHTLCEIVESRLCTPLLA